MTYHYYGDKNADIVLIQPVGDHDLPDKKAHECGFSAYCGEGR